MGASVGSLVSIAVAAALAGGQQPSPSTRAAALEAERAAKAAALTPYIPSKPEAILFAIEDHYLVERYLNAPRGLYARLGGLPTGSGIAGGPAYRQSTHTYSATVTTAASFLRAWEVTASLAFPDMADDNAFFEIRARKREMPLEDYFGLGPDTRESDRTSYRYRDVVVEANGGITPGDSVTLGGSVAYVAPSVGPRGGPEGGRNGIPSIETVFDDSTAPGLDAQPDYVRLALGLGIDTTDLTAGSLSGVRLQAGLARYADQDLGAYSFNRWTVDVRTYLPVLHGARTLALRAVVDNLDPDAGHEVPFYYRPTIGGHDSVRGLRTYRFRDRTLAFFQAEYRWPVNAFLGGVFFYEGGTVADGLGRLTSRTVQQDFGVGLRVGFLARAFLRTEVAFGAEGSPRLVVRFGDVF